MVSKFFSPLEKPENLLMMGSINDLGEYNDDVFGTLGDHLCVSH